MAEQLSRVLGTERDRVNCPFYFRIGACRHGDRCSRTHLRPLFAQTVMIPHMYAQPLLPPYPDDPQQLPRPPSPGHIASHFEDFMEEAVDELSKYGKILEVHVTCNAGDHLNGNVYVKYDDESQALECINAIKGRFYEGRFLMPEYSPVIDFDDAVCGMFKRGSCSRGDFCNFMHVKEISRSLHKRLFGRRDRDRSRSRSRDRKHRHRSRSRSRDRDRRRSRRSRSGSRDRSSRKSDRDEQKSSSSSTATAHSEERTARGSSAERRAKIAEWNKAKKAPAADASAAPATEQSHHN